MKNFLQAIFCERLAMSVQPLIRQIVPARRSAQAIKSSETDRTGYLFKRQQSCSGLNDYPPMDMDDRSPNIPLTCFLRRNSQRDYLNQHQLETENPSRRWNMTT